MLEGVSKLGYFSLDPDQYSILMWYQYLAERGPPVPISNTLLKGLMTGVSPSCMQKERVIVHDLGDNKGPSRTNKQPFAICVMALIQGP